jgi:hypothetical protein
LTPATAAKVEGLASSLGAHVMANEDVRGGWSRAFDLPTGAGDVAWRLISPGGGVTWMHNGRLASDMLSRALDEGLIRCKPVSSVPMGGGLKVGMLVGASSLRQELLELMEAEPKCPPMPLNRQGLGSVVAFAQSGSASSLEQVRALHAQFGDEREGRPAVAIVLDGADPRSARAFKDQLGVDVAILPDETGAIARRFGVQIWPTTLRVNRDGIVSDVQLGRRPADARVDEDRVEPIE